MSKPVVYTTNTIANRDGTATYPVDFIREFFIKNEMSIEELAIQMNLPIETVQRHANEGMESWYKLKQDRLAERLKYFMDVNVDNVTETHSLLEDGHFLTIVQIKGMQEWLKRYYIRYGHLFRVDPDSGDISLDPNGVPMPLPLPNGPKQFMALEGFLKLKEATKAALHQIHESSKAKGKIEVIDADDFLTEGDGE